MFSTVKILSLILSVPTLLLFVHLKIMFRVNSCLDDTAPPAFSCISSSSDTCPTGCSGPARMDALQPPSGRARVAPGVREKLHRGGVEIKILKLRCEVYTSRKVLFSIIIRCVGSGPRMITFNMAFQRGFSFRNRPVLTIIPEIGEIYNDELRGVRGIC